LNGLSVFDRCLGNEVPSLALGTAYVDSGSKGYGCQIGGTHATDASKTWTQPFSFLVYRWRVMDVLRLQSSDNVSAIWDEVDEIRRPSHFQQKTMITIFCNGTRECKVSILSAGQKMNTRYLMECMLGV
jgi:hypothetical protein